MTVVGREHAALSELRQPKAATSRAQGYAICSANSTGYFASYSKEGFALTMGSTKFVRPL
jgi:hypothetical protein